ncbi:MAG: hypothetical protein RIQ89_1237, partial [Bacteroidota bacterium]
PIPIHFTMSQFNHKVDLIIAKAPAYAQPIMLHLRSLVHKAHPAIEENIKWGSISFEYKGIVCSMAAFKAHVSFGFWKAKLMKDADLLLHNQASAMGHLGKLTQLKDLPSDKLLIAYIKEAVLLNEINAKLPLKKKITEQTPISFDPDFIHQLKKHRIAYSHFMAMSPSCKKEYNEWITEAKRPETKTNRINTTIANCDENKSLHWKYKK